MGVFANVPNSKYDKLSDEEKAKVDAWRGQENDIEKQEREAGNYTDVVGRDDNKSVEKTATRKSAPKSNS